MSNHFWQGRIKKEASCLLLKKQILYNQIVLKKKRRKEKEKYQPALLEKAGHPYQWHALIVKVHV